MKNKPLYTGLISGVIIGLLFLAFSFLQTNPETAQKVDCTVLRESFDNAIKKRDLPIIENPESLCHGLYVGLDFSAIAPKWAVGELIAIEGARLTFRGISEEVSIWVGLNDEEVVQYEIGRNYKIDIKNMCREFFMMADSRYPSPIATTFVQPEEINCR